MTALKIGILIPLATAASLLSGCDGEKSAKPESEEKAGAGGVSAVTYKEGRGLKFMPETAAAIGLKTEAVEERSVPRSLQVSALVLDAGPPARLSASVATNDADWLEKTVLREVVSLGVNRDSAAVTGLADLTLTLDRSDLSSGRFVPVTLTARESAPVTSVPRSAVLRVAEGTFVYALNGDHFLRTPVKIGAESGAYVEITDGLYSGDVVATSPVEQLWLIELRAVKGGAGCD